MQRDSYHHPSRVTSLPDHWLHSESRNLERWRPSCSDPTHPNNDDTHNHARCETCVVTVFSCHSRSCSRVVCACPRRWMRVVWFISEVFLLCVFLLTHIGRACTCASGTAAANKATQANRREKADMADDNWRRGEGREGPRGDENRARSEVKWEAEQHSGVRSPR